MSNEDVVRSVKVFALAFILYAVLIISYLGIINEIGAYETAFEFWFGLTIVACMLSMPSAFITSLLYYVYRLIKKLDYNRTIGG